MSKRKQAASGTTLQVGDLTQVYTQYREVLVRRATRRVQNSLIAEEIVQEAFLKCILAAPEISSQDHLLAYLNTSIDNLSINHGSKLSNRTHLVAIDSETSQAEIDSLLATNVNDELADELIRAEDAAIVRQAIARLTPADRDLLLLSEFEGLSPEAIAAQFGMSPTTVKSSLTRARAALRRTLDEWIVDEATGMTATQYLSRTGRKIAENSKKIGAGALSLILLVSAFFGFWNNPTTPVQVASPKVTKTIPLAEAPTATSNETQTPDATASLVRTTNPVQSLETWAVTFLSKTGPLGWPGLDADGLPVGFTVNNGAGLNGLALITQDPFVMNTNTGVVSTESRFTTFQDGINVILSQKVSNKDGVISYNVNPLVRVGGSWIELVIAEKSIEIKPLADGNFLITSFMIVDLEKTAKATPIAGAGLGTDLAGLPAVVATRLLTTAIGQPVIGQAVQVLGAPN